MQSAGSGHATSRKKKKLLRLSSDDTSTPKNQKRAVACLTRSATEMQMPAASWAPRRPRQKYSMEQSLSSSVTNKTLCFFREALTSLCSAMGMQEDRYDDMLSSIDRNLSIKAHKALKKNETLSNNATESLNKLQSKIKKIIIHQTKASSLAKVQGIIRGHLFRKRFLNIPREALKASTTKIYQIITSEKKFIRALRHYSSHILDPLKTNHSKITKNTFHYLENGMPRIISVHEIFVSELENIFAHEEFPVQRAPCLCDCILENMKRISNTYTKYSIYMDACNATFDHYLDTLPPFLTLVSAAYKNTNPAAKAKKIMQSPREHFLSLHTRLKSFRRSYFDNRTLKQNVLEEALSCMETTSEHIGGNAEPFFLSSDRKTLLQIEWDMEVSDSPLYLLNWYDRKFLKAGPLRINGKRKFLHLFSDYALVSHDKQHGMECYSYLYSIPLSRSEITVISEKEFRIQGETENSFFQCQCASKNESMEWQHEISTIIEIYKQNRVFGVPLSQLVSRESSHDGIPFCLKQTLQWISDHGRTTEGIFRVPGDNGYMRECKTLYDRGSAPRFLSLYSIHDIAGLCKLYLRELPIPLIPFNSYDSIIACAKRHEGEKDLSRTLDELADIVASIPIFRSNVLHFVLKFLLEFSHFHLQTKMGVANLALVFSPNIIRVEVDSMDSAMLSPLVSKFFVVIVEHHEEIWRAAEIKKSQQSEESNVNRLIETILTKQGTGGGLSLQDAQELKELSHRPATYIPIGGETKGDSTSTNGRIGPIRKLQTRTKQAVPLSREYFTQKKDE